MKISAGLLSFVVTFVAFSGISSAQITFRSVDHVNHPVTGSHYFIMSVNGVSNRGDIVGNSGNGVGDGLGFRLDGTDGGVMVYALPEFSGTFAAGISANGQTALVTNDIGYGAYLVTGSTIVNLGGPDGQVLLTEQFSCTGDAVSARSGFGNARYRWCANQGWQQLNLPSGLTRSNVTDLSDDGMVAVGYAGTFGPLDRVGVLWDSTGTPHTFEPLDGFTRNRLSFVSGDGTAAIGYSYNPSGSRQAFRWTEAEGVVPINFAGGVIPSLANSSLTTFVLPSSILLPDIWSEEYGFFNLHQSLVDQGFVQAEWEFNISSISPDGYSFGGTFRGDDGWLRAWSATIPAPSTAAAVIMTGLFVGRRRR